MTDVRRGLIIVNTGPGKGKPTAAMGTALPAVGQGVFGDKFVIKQTGRGFVKVGAERPDPEDVGMLDEAWVEAEKSIQSGDWDLVVLDEINYAIRLRHARSGEGGNKPSRRNRKWCMLS